MFVSILPWLLLISAFVLIGFFYSELPPDILIARGMFGGHPLIGPKTLFTAFRPPLIELICALVVKVMSRSDLVADTRTAYKTFWLILLYTLGFKSLFQAFEIVANPLSAPVFYSVTITFVLIGIACAAPFGWSLLRRDRSKWRIDSVEKLQLFGLLAAYILTAILPIWIYR
jgi:hypothetical protein